MATASNPVNVHNGSRAGLLATALMVMALIALLVLTVIGILFYMDYSGDQAAKRNGASTVEIKAPAGSSVDQGGAAGSAGTGAGSGSTSGSGSTGTGAAGGAGGAGGSAPAQGGDTIRITVPNVTVPNVPGQ